MIDIIPTTPEHVEWMQEHCRAADRAEFWESHYQTPRLAAEISMQSGDTFTALHDGLPLCIFGIIPQSIVPKVGHIWLVSSPQLLQCRRAFLRRCKSWLLAKAQDYDILLNYVDARYVESVRWVEWLGFKIDDAKPYGQNGLPFHKITFRGGEHGISMDSSSSHRKHASDSKQSAQSGERAG